MPCQRRHGRPKGPLHSRVDDLPADARSSYPFARRRAAVLAWFRSAYRSGRQTHIWERVTFILFLTRFCVKISDVYLKGQRRTHKCCGVTVWSLRPCDWWF